MRVVFTGVDVHAVRFFDGEEPCRFILLGLIVFVRVVKKLGGKFEQRRGRTLDDCERAGLGSAWHGGRSTLKA